MATRHALLLTLGLAFASSSALAPNTAAAQQEDDQALPEVENARYQFIGKVTNTTYVRSGPSKNFYATAKLEKGAEVTVVGIKYQWLKIVPPPGSFSLVPKVYVNRRGDGKIARVTNTLNVRAGSSENAMKSTIQTKLEPGQDVEIIDEQDEYYKIVPPEGAYLFVQMHDVQPIRRTDQPGQIVSNDGQAAEPQPQRPQDVPAGPEAGETAAEAPSDDAAAAPTDEVATLNLQPEQADPALAGPDTQPADDTTATADAGEAPATTTKPARVNVAEEFRRLESEFEAASKQSVADQPIEQLTEGYTKLVEAGGLRGSMKRIADARLQALQIRADAREQLLAFRKGQEEMRRRHEELKVEQQEIDERIAQTRVELYTAVGTLRVSSIQQGDTVLYRLVDPGTNRTLVYIRSNDPKYAGLLNQFVGVRGDLTNDARLKMKIITPKEAEPVDASKVNNTVIATVTPPSMVTTSVSADQGDATVAE